MSNSKKYIALTIGPIYKTLQFARTTGELWGGSYIFSYMMKKIIEKLLEKNRNFVIPNVEDDTLFEKGKEVGLFHDRFIFEVEEKGDFEELGHIIQELLDQMAKDISDALGKMKEKDRKEIRDYLQNYFQFYYIEKEVVENPILELSPILDTIELQSQYVKQESINYILEFLKNDHIKKSFLMKGMNIKGFTSLYEIASSGLEIKDIKADDEDYYKEVKERLKKENRLDEFKKVYKYVAIVQADGDNMSSIIKKLSDGQGIDKKIEQETEKDSITTFQEFSSKLHQFASEAHRIIKGDNKGMTIYAGGDDLLFFAPVFSKGKHVFSVLDEITNEFDNQFNTSKNMEDRPTLSFGVSIFYYKYPLYEALEEARDLLYRSKNYINGDDKKNAISFSVIQHSGQAFGTTFKKNSESYLIFKRILDLSIEQSDFLKQVYHTLMRDQVLLKEIIGDKVRLKNYFENNFNESIHKQEKNKKYLDLVQELLYTVNREYDKSFDEKMEIVYSYLKFTHFLNEEGDEN